jgi:phosphate transport system permease protein
MSSKATSERPSSSKWSRGEHLIWLTGSALGICLLMILGLLAVILSNGLGIFWPSPIEKVTLKDGSVIAGEPIQRQAIPNPGHADNLEKHRIQLKVGNRDLYGFDFKWIDESEIAKHEEPAGLYLVERSSSGRRRRSSRATRRSRSGPRRLRPGCRSSWRRPPGTGPT